MTTHHRALIAAAGSGILVGASLVASRSVIQNTAITPTGLAFLRYVIGSLCLLPFALYGPRARIPGAHLVPIAALGIVQFAAVVVLLNAAVEHITAARSALLFASTPVITMGLSVILRRESLSLVRSSGVILTIVGVAFALGSDATGASGAAWAGEALALGAAGCAAASSVASGRVLVRYPILQVSFLAMLAAVVSLALAVVREGSIGWSPDVGVGHTLAIVFTGVASGGGYFLWRWALTHTSPTNVTVFLALSPVTATALGVVLLDEPFGFATLAGLLLVTLGLRVALRQSP